MPEEPSSPDAPNCCPPEYRELVTSCWDSDPALRPTFLEVMTRLASMHEVGSRSSLFDTLSPSHGLSESCDDDVVGHDSSWTLPSAMSDHDYDSSAGDSLARFPSRAAMSKRSGASLSSPPPEGDLTIVCTDISGAASLWEFDAEPMRDATLLHNDVLRAALKRHHGYESVTPAPSSSSQGGGGEGSFCMAFRQAADALAWCADVQRALLEVEWPTALLGHSGAGQETDAEDRSRLVFKGLRVRMGVHAGSPKVVRDPMTRRVDYVGPVVDAAARITAMTHGGQIVLSHAVYDKLGRTDAKRSQHLGKFDVDTSTIGKHTYRRMTHDTHDTHSHNSTRRTRTRTHTPHTLMVAFSGSDGAVRVQGGRARRASFRRPRVGRRRGGWPRPAPT
jgi:class 3 adenylate cyclase